MRDLVIVGGGLVGLCAALVMQHPARRVRLVDASDFSLEPSAGINARSIALARSSVQVFRAIGVWEQLAERAVPIRHIHISARGRWGVTRIAAADCELEALGYVIENRHLQHCLRTAAAAASNIDLLDQSEFDSIEQGAAVQVGYRRQGKTRRTKASMALIADGAQSPARAALGIAHDSLDYGQTVLICNVEVDRPCADTAYERFTAEGPLAMLPLGGERYACVWTMKPERAEALCQLDAAQFGRALQRSFGFRLGTLERAGERFALPLTRVRAESLQRGRCIVIGNAANALHPVAGQGFNLALRDLACLYELLAEQTLSDLGAAQIRQFAIEYERQRQVEQGRVIRYGDGLVSLFSNELPVLDRARAAALGVLDLIPALKTQVALTGMGLSFGGNRLLRGHL